MNPKIKKFDPAVDKRILVAISGLIWTAVGTLLCTRAVNWLSEATDQKTMWLSITGILLALAIHHFCFVKLANKNIKRIMAKEGKVCIFGFQPWKSYFIILIMISFGIILRQSSIPKPYLSIIYMGFGGAMFLSSIRYHRIFFKLL